MENRHLYIETDGMVYLVKENGKFTLPTSQEAVPFPFDSHSEMHFEDDVVVYCTPDLEQHPTHWHHKDIIPGRDDVTPLVRMAVNRTLPRVVCEAVIVKGGRILLVKPSRGFNKGYWTLPGGFVSYGEAPEAAVIREVGEEVGVDAKLVKLLGVETFVGKDSFFTWHMFFYSVELLSELFNPPADEIEEVRWFELEDGLDQLYGVKRLKLQKYFKTD